MFERPSLQTIVDRILSDIKSRVTGAATFTRRSVMRILGRVFAGSVHLLYGFLNYMADQLFVTTADSEYIDIHANEFGKVRKAAVKATGEATAIGTNGVTIPANTELQSDDGIIYLTDEVAVISSGIADLEITAEVAGADGNDDAGIQLTFVSPINGIDTTATVDTNGLTGGLDEETDAELQARVLERKRAAPYGGTETDYEAWMKEISGVTRAWAFPLWQGAGTVGLAFVRDNDANTIIPNDTQRTEVETYITSHTDSLTGSTIGKPVTAAIYMIPLTEYTVDFNVSIYPNTTAVQTSVTSQLSDLLLTVGPGETLAISQIDAAISAATDEQYHRLNTPSADVGFATTRVPVLGTITFQDYS